MPRLREAALLLETLSVNKRRVTLYSLRCSVQQSDAVVGQGSEAVGVLR